MDDVPFVFIAKQPNLQIFNLWGKLIDIARKIMTSALDISVT